MRKTLLLLLAFGVTLAFGQNTMTPELLWNLGRVSVMGISKDKQYIVYKVTNPNVDSNNFVSKKYFIPVNGGSPVAIDNADSLLRNIKVSPDGKNIIFSKEVKVEKVFGSDFYPDLQKSNVHIYTSLNYRHWDEWEDGKFSHIFVAPYNNGKVGEGKDLMEGEPYDSPQKPFGGAEDFIWNPDSKRILYVTKRKFGTDYALSTNTDLFEYSLETGKTKNLTEGMMGYDVNPLYNSKGDLAWLSMKREGYEADKQDIIVLSNGKKFNLTEKRDDLHVEGFIWGTDDKTIFFIAPANGTLQVFSAAFDESAHPVIKQITKGDFDVSALHIQSGNQLIVTRTDMNHAAEVYSVNLSNGNMNQLTHVNDDFYKSIDLVKTERRWVKTADNKNMLVWIIYPPNFDPGKKYPTLLYCQGGPQSPLTQFYSFRWNFQLMASQGYIIVAPNRRGMPGHGTKWNEEVSKDWGGKVIQDYLDAIDAISKEAFVDTARRGCVGASFGGFSVFELAGVHKGRFKSFISHDGVFDFRSMYGTTDEMFFENWEKGGPYWDKHNVVAQRSFSQSPSNFVQNWNTPILIVQGGKDYRVPIEQGQQAFQAAQLLGIKSKFVYLPDENHWVLQPQNAMVWQREFFGWLKETIK